MINSGGDTMRRRARLQAILSWLFRRNQVERDLDAELRDHFAQEIENGIRAGLSPEEARFAAQRLFGSVSLYKEECRDARGIGFIETAVRDLRYAFRRLRSSRGFTAAAILTLALGIGANVTIFSLVNTIVFRPFGVKNQDELVFLNYHTSKMELPGISYPDYKDYRDRNTVLSGLAAFGYEAINISHSGTQNRRLWGYSVSGNYFDMLGVQPARGRVLHPADDVKRGGHPVAVLAYGCWQAYFGGDPNVVGSRVKIDGLDYTIVGVAPQAFIGTEIMFTPQIFIPLAMAEQIEQKKWMDDRTNISPSGAWAIGRLKPGVSAKTAEAAINNIAADLAREYPKIDAGASIVISPPGMAGTFMRGPLIGFSAVIMVVAGLVLLIACVNLAGLLLARAGDRRKEIAVRLALGASQGQLLRQLLTESLLLSIAGGAAGLLLAYWLTALVNAWRPPLDVPIMPRVEIDTHVLLFATAVSLLSAFLFGLAPALQSARTGLTGAIKNDAPSQKLRRLNLRDILVTVQVALSVVLLVGSILVVRSLQHALSLDLGFEPEHASILSIDLTGQGYDEKRGREFQRLLLDKVRAMPGIQAAGMSAAPPLTITSATSDSVYFEGKPEPRAGDVPMARLFTITPGYLEAMHTRLDAGRDVGEHDKQDSTAVALVNENFVRRFLPGANPIGKRFRHSTTGKWIQIAGVVEDGKYYSLGEAQQPAVFEPLEQRWSQAQTLIARSSMPEAETVRLMRRAVLQLDSSFTVFDDEPLTSAIGVALFPARMAAVVLASFGVLALVLATTGVYGIMAYAVSRRTREIGIRMALGAIPSQVARLVLARTAIMLGAGVAIGLVLAFAGGTFFSVILYGISPHDPTTYLCAIAFMSVIAFVACWLPARRAIHVDPLTALRTE
jgi:predicted permease